MHEIKPVLLVEDNPKDAELTLAALAENNLVNRVTHVKDGV
ncbi:MAG: response regulator, partial [Armatimonadota bacterium]